MCLPSGYINTLTGFLILLIYLLTNHKVKNRLTHVLMIYTMPDYNVDVRTSISPLCDDCNWCLFFPQDGCGEGQDRGHGRQRRLLLHQNTVQLRGAVDQGAQVYAHKPEVGTRLGHLTVLQQINLLDFASYWVLDEKWSSCGARAKGKEIVISAPFCPFLGLSVQKKTKHGAMSRSSVWIVFLLRDKLWAHCGSTEDRHRL